MPTLPDEFQIPEPGNQAAFETVRLVEEALVIVPVVDQKVGRVAYVVEALVITPLLIQAVSLTVR